MTPRHKLRIATMIAALAGLSLAISAMPGATAAPPDRPPKGVAQPPPAVFANV